jgi:serine/threonine protein phosphatase PrpC
VRKLNEDSLLDCPDAGLWAVADGMGGHQAGDFASRSIVESLHDVPVPERLSAYVDDVEDRLLLVNRKLVEAASEREYAVTIGSTVVVLVALRRHCACLWAGDSRAYRLRDGVMQMVSRDHSQVEEMVEEGLLLREDAESHPAANVITRAVGADETLYLDIELQELRDGDRYLLCSDGLYKEISEADIAAQLQQGSCQDVCDQLLQQVLERGARDNVTIVTIEFRAVGA